MVVSWRQHRALAVVPPFVKPLSDFPHVPRFLFEVELSDASNRSLSFWLTGLFLLNYSYRPGVGRKPSSFQDLWNLGFGSVEFHSLFQLPYAPGSVVSQVMLANLPQLILSLVYTSYNAIFTCMLLTDEYNDFVVARKTLRVSEPQGKHRSSYFLQLPYRYALPLMAASTGLQWLISQCLFLVQISTSNYDGSDTMVMTTCGWSVIAVIFMLSVGGTFILVLSGFGFRRYKAGIPIASSCSLAIAAACHPKPEEENRDIAVLPLMYGEVWRGEDGVGHAAFSSEVVKVLEHGRYYK